MGTPFFMEGIVSVPTVTSNGTSATTFAPPSPDDLHRAFAAGRAQALREAAEVAREVDLGDEADPAGRIAAAIEALAEGREG